MELKELKHLSTCDSTQSVLKQIMDENPEHEAIAVSTDLQTNGIGRKGQDWLHFEDSLAVSFCVLPSKTLSITPLELGLLTIQFVEQNFKEKLYLKWPNDIMNKNNQKVGGIIIQSSKSKFYIAGIGLNFSEKENEYSFEYFNAGFIKSHGKIDKKKVSLELVNYILENRISDAHEIKIQWETNCIHMNKEIQIVDNSSTIAKGKFTGIGKAGEALILKDGEINGFYSGSLLY